MRLPHPYQSEAQAVSNCLAKVTRSLEWSRVINTATPWIENVRQHPAPFWAMETLLKEFPISTPEGLALMRLAEALLRIPDVETAMALTADQLHSASFDTDGHSALAKLSTQAIALSKKLLPQENDHADGLGTLGAKTVVRATLRAVQLLGHQFVLGRDIPEAQAHATQLRSEYPHLRFSYDMLGEGARTAEDAKRYLALYHRALEGLRSSSSPGQQPFEQDGISIKLSALHPRYEQGQRDRVLRELIPAVWSLCEQAALINVNLTLDAEEVDRLELSLDIADILMQKISEHHPQWTGFGLAIQAYQTRAVDVVEHLVALAKQHNIRLMCRLVKGAYWDAEIKRAQELGLPHYPVYTHKNHTDISYLACAHAMFDGSPWIYPQFATHNAGTIAALLHMGAQSGIPFELQRLHGMGEGVYREVLKNPLIHCRVYAPVGAHRDLLAYLVRRMLENGANTSFVHQLANPDLSPTTLLTSPLRLEASSTIQLPGQLFGSARINSTGMDITLDTTQLTLTRALQTLTPVPIEYVSTASVEAACGRAANAFHTWSTTPIETRASILEQAADHMQGEFERWCARLVQEGLKTWNDAIPEVREAIDYLRYYAQQARFSLQAVPLPGPTGERNILYWQPRGVWLCISPWNFPLAIFIGQISAALVTGNCALAKPAEQTPAIAACAVDLLYQCGVPRDCLGLLQGPGETVGAALVAQPCIAGVVFTGSSAVAKQIARALADKPGPIVPLVAETGGVNAMIVDSTAVLEQTCDAIVQSAFRSSGQRCSALRLLCVHEAIADSLIRLLEGAMRELRVGPPDLFCTDMGPLIDQDAWERAKGHILHLQTHALHAFVPDTFNDPGTHPPGLHLMAPHLFEIERIGQAREEIFAPVLQVVRWGGDVQSVIEQINQLGYGLTLGIQSRIDSRSLALSQRAQAGNVYINRNMIGAVVGVQPFGGQGLSGTGPKAGGPHYLYRFCHEKTVTINTTAAGGNATLMASDID